MNLPNIIAHHELNILPNRFRVSFNYWDNFTKILGDFHDVSNITQHRDVHSSRIFGIQQNLVSNEPTFDLRLDVSREYSLRSEAFLESFAENLQKRACTVNSKQLF